MHNRVVRVAGLTGFLMCLAAPSFAQGPELPYNGYKTLGIGMQSSFPVWGASVMYNASPRVSVQGVLGAFGTLKMYGGRALYRFDRGSGVRPYVFGSLGMFSYEGYRLSNSGYSVDKTTETVFGVGAGGGVEYFFQGLSDLGFNAEIGFGSVKFKEIDYNFSAISVGVGVHYYIK